MTTESTTSTDGGAAVIGPRRINLTVLPVEENVEWPRKDYALSITADGSRDSLAMTCVVEKSTMGVPNASTVRIWNLAEETREALSLKGLQAEISIADPYSKDLHIIFKGGILSCISDRSGADIITTIYILSNVMLLQCTPASYGFESTPIKDVLEEVRELLGLAKLRMHGFDEGRIVKRFSFMGTAQGMLNKLAFQEAFSWSVDKGELIAVADGKTTGNVATFTPETGLIKAVPILKGAFYDQNGVMADVYPNSQLECWDQLKLESKINPKSCNRDDLRVATLKYTLSTIDDSWIMQAECYAAGLQGM
jgi:hypothetical protein